MATKIRGSVNSVLHNKNTFPFFFRTSSIKKTLWLSYIIIVVLMVIPTIYSISLSSIHTQQYDGIITNVSKANRLNQIVKMDISNEVWDIVAGKKEFSEGQQYEILKIITDGINEMLDSSESDVNKQLLEVSLRAIQTLTKYIDMLGQQINEGASVDENEKVLDEVRGVSALIYDILQDFIVSEIETAAQTNESIKAASLNLTFIQIFITAFIIILALYAINSVSEKIRKPIQDMENLSSQIAHGNFDVRINIPRVEELENVSANLNIMAGKIQKLIDENIREQQNLQKAEMKTLQAQITPHFLYNTFDTIIWLAESGDNEEVIEITRAFSDFFRISLSKGHEWIPLEQEIEHARNYLTIQKIRYRDILDYSIDFDPELKDKQVLKLVLQPLVENAIYHGIKNKRGRGLLKVSAKLINNSILFSVEDNGIGFTKERLEQVMSEIHKDSDIEKLSAVYGLYNVNKRLNLYYGEEVKLKIESTRGEGTTVSFSVPALNGEQIV